MTKRELFDILNDYHDDDEVIVVSPGNRALHLTGYNPSATDKYSAIAIDSTWD